MTQKHEDTAMKKELAQHIVKARESVSGKAEARIVRVIARGEGWAMVRRERAMPYVVREDELLPLGDAMVERRP